MGDWQCTGPLLPMGGSSADIVVNSKRQRRPSVRLGEIGDQSAAYAYSSQDLIRRKKQKQWNQPPTGFFRNASDFPGGSGTLSKTRPLLNISSDEQVILDDPISHCGFPSDEGGKMQLNPICVSKKLRHGRTRRRGVGLVGKMTRTMRVSPESNNNGQDKGSGDDNGFGASYDADTPECFKDSDLDTSFSFSLFISDMSMGHFGLPTLFVYRLLVTRKFVYRLQASNLKASVPVKGLFTCHRRP